MDLEEEDVCRYLVSDRYQTSMRHAHSRAIYLLEEGTCCRNGRLGPVKVVWACGAIEHIEHF